MHEVFAHTQSSEEFSHSTFQEQDTEQVIEKKESLKPYGWDLVYLLARTAQRKGVDLSTMSTEAYARFAEENDVAFPHMVITPSERMATNFIEVMEINMRLAETCYRTRHPIMNPTPPQGGQAEELF